MTRSIRLTHLLAIRTSAFGPDHPSTRATAARLRAAQDLPLGGQWTMLTDVAYLREMGCAGHMNRAHRKHLNS